MLLIIVLAFFLLFPFFSVMFQCYLRSLALSWFPLSLVLYTVLSLQRHSDLRISSFLLSCRGFFASSFLCLLHCYLCYLYPIEEREKKDSIGEKLVKLSGLGAQSLSSEGVCNDFGLH